MSFKKSYFLLFDEPLICDLKDTLNFPEHMNIVAYFDETEMKYIGKSKDYQVTYDNGCTSFINNQNLMELTMVILFSNQKQYGLLLCDITDEDIGFVQICGLQLGSLFNFMELNKLEQNAQSKLQDSLHVIQAQNKTLNLLSKYDDLTKLLNRRGFMEKALNIYNQNQGKQGYLIFGDLDPLKEINDVYGHSERDFAIITIAERFKKYCLTIQSSAGLVATNSLPLLYQMMCHLKNIF